MHHSWDSVYNHIVVAVISVFMKACWFCVCVCVVVSCYNIPSVKTAQWLSAYHVWGFVELYTERRRVTPQVYCCSELPGLVIPLEMLECLVDHPVVHEHQARCVEGSRRTQHDA